MGTAKNDDNLVDFTRLNNDAFGLCTDTDFSAVHTNSEAPNPTVECMLYWVAVYKVMNRCLFGGQLPHCMITLERRKNALGYFLPDSFENRDGHVVHQIAMNPSYFAPLGDLEALQTFAHEMCHLWREVFGPRNKNGGCGTRGYHCRAWGRKMEEIGLMPSHTGEPGGRKTGYRMSDYVIEGSKFDLLTRELLLSGMEVNWRDPVEEVAACQNSSGTTSAHGSRNGTRPKARQTRAKFTCPQCGLNAWAKHSASLSCGMCRVALRNAASFAGSAK